jgi:predicted alpha/beta-hydrolase family hydrolase
MLKNLSYKYYHKLNNETVYLVLHGGGPEGIETDFISKIINSIATTKNSVIGINFPYCERGQEESSGKELLEETKALNDTIKFLESEGYKKIVIVTKSLGAIVASYWLDEYKPNAPNMEVVILGYVIGAVKTKQLNGHLKLVIQGENDRFGNSDVVNKELSKYKISAKVVEVPSADHSYRNERKEPVYQSAAIELMIKELL